MLGRSTNKGNSMRLSIFGKKVIKKSLIELKIISWLDSTTSTGCKWTNMRWICKGVCWCPTVKTGIVNDFIKNVYLWNRQQHGTSRRRGWYKNQEIKIKYHHQWYISLIKFSSSTKGDNFTPKYHVWLLVLHINHMYSICILIWRGCQLNKQEERSRKS